MLVCAWLLLVAVDLAAEGFGVELRLVGMAATLTALWIVLRASTLLFQDALLARIVAAAAWIVAALDILGLLGATLDMPRQSRADDRHGAAVAAAGRQGGAADRDPAYGPRWRWRGWSAAASSTSPASARRSRR